MESEMTKGAAHVLTHGTARTRAMQGGGSGKGGGGKMAESAHMGGDGKKRIKRMEIEPAHGGGHVVKHIHHQAPGGPMPAEPQEDEVYAIPSTEALHQHIDQHLGGGEAEPGAEEHMAEEQAAAGGGGAAEAGESAGA